MLLLFKVECGTARAHVLAHSKQQAKDLWLEGADDNSPGVRGPQIDIKALPAVPRVTGCWEEV